MAKPVQEGEARGAHLKPRSGRGDRALSFEQFANLAPFRGKDPKGAPLGPDYWTKKVKVPDAFVLRYFDNGELLFNQGDPGFTAFYLLSSDEIRTILGVAPPARAVETGPRVKARSYVRAAPPAGGAVLNWFGRLTSGKARSRQAETPRRALVGPLERSGFRCVASHYEGEVLGDMSCRHRTPRSATIRAEEPTYALEMLKVVWEEIAKVKGNEEFTQRLEQTYRQRALESHLATLPILASLSDAQRAELQKRVKLVEKDPGEVIIREGDPGDDVFLISIGQVRVIKKAPGGDRILGVLMRNDVFGERTALEGGRRSATIIAHEHARRSDRPGRPLGKTELIQIAKADFDWLLETAPSVAEEIRRVKEQRKAAPEAPSAVEAAWLTVSGRFHELGLVQGQKLMLIDLDRCTRCDECVRACVSTHDDGRTRLLREGERFGNFLVPSTCRQCRDPVCLVGCPVSSIHKGPGNEIVIEDWCIGCAKCAAQCPYDAINMSQREGQVIDRPLKTGDDRVAYTCDQCQSLFDGQPSCVYACPHDAALRVDALEFFDARRAGRRSASMAAVR